MTEKEAIEKCNFMNDALNFQRVESDECSCALQMAIAALEEIQKYHAIGTVEECRCAMNKQLNQNLTEVSHMKYRLTTQHYKSDSEQNVTITECKEDVKKTYLDSCRKDYFTLLERCRCGEWERIMFQLEQGNVEKELDYILDN